MIAETALFGEPFPVRGNCLSTGLSARARDRHTEAQPRHSGFGRKYADLARSCGLGSRLPPAWSLVTDLKSHKSAEIFWRDA